jgi:hypothetical protein
MTDDARTVSFRAPQPLVAAMEKVAEQELCTVSHVVRAAVLRELRQRGLMTETAAA